MRAIAPWRVEGWLQGTDKNKLRGWCVIPDAKGMLLTGPEDL